MRFLIPLASLLISTTLCGAASYRVGTKIPISGDGGWDYVTVDPDNRRVYIAHSTEVVVLDADTNAVVGRIPDLKGAHGVAIAPEFSRGFISNGQSGMVTVFDTKTLKKVGDALKVEKNPDAIVYDPATGRVFVFNEGSSSATAIDAELSAVVGTVNLQGKPEFAVSDGANAIFVNLEDKGVVARIDARKLLVEQLYPLAPCQEPSALAINRVTRRLFVGCGNNTMAVVSADSGKIITTMPICSGVDAMAFDPEAALILHSCGDGTVSVVHEDSADKYTAQETLQTRAGSKTMGLDTKTHKLFVPTADFEAAAPVKEGEKPARRKIVPGSFGLLVVER